MVHSSCFDLKGETALHAGRPSLIAVMGHMYDQTWLLDLYNRRRLFSRRGNGNSALAHGQVFFVFSERMKVSAHEKWLIEMHSSGSNFLTSLPPSHQIL